MSDITEHSTDFSPSFRLDLPRKSQGEDAPPFICQTPSELWLGVCDGMGGSGASLYETPNGKQTGAYMASRIVAAAVQDWIHAGRNFDVPVVDQIMTVSLGALRSAAASLKIEPSRLKSKLLRTLPTTIALARVTPASSGNVNITAYWAGDSRVYVLFPLHMLQLTRDHIVGSADAFDNLTQDSPLSNCMSADQNFYVESATILAYPPFVVIAATDGCFGYFNSPILFEELILKAMQRATCMAEWSSYLAEDITKVTGDDSSMALSVFGVNNFENLKWAFAPRAEAISATAEKIRNSEHLAEVTKVQAEASKQELHELLASTWNEYRRDYEFPHPTVKSSDDNA